MKSYFLENLHSCHEIHGQFVYYCLSANKNLLEHGKFLSNYIWNGTFYFILIANVISFRLVCSNSSNLFLTYTRVLPQDTSVIWQAEHVIDNGEDLYTVVGTLWAIVLCNLYLPVPAYIYGRMLSHGHSDLRLEQSIATKLCTIEYILPQHKNLF